MKKLIIVLMCLSFQVKSWVSVGSSPGFGSCDYTSIQDAIDSGDTEIRVLNNQEFIENIQIDRTLELKGGYNSCLSAQLNLQGEDKTVIRGTQAIGGPVVNITSDQNAIPVPFVRIYNVTLTGGLDTEFVDGGNGIRIENSSVWLNIYDSTIVDNFAERGGGIYVNNPLNAAISLYNTKITDNEASYNGGGIHCANSETLVSILPLSEVSENRADNGGGIYASNGCKVNVYSGSQTQSTFNLQGVIKNIANINGGGIFAEDGAEIQLIGSREGGLGDASQPASLSQNNAQNNGGGMYAGNGAIVRITDGYVYGNKASNNGGAFYIQDGVELIINQSDSGSCWEPHNYCSQIFKNTAAANGGAIYARDGAVYSVLRSKLFENRADVGTVAYQNAALTHSIMKNNIFYQNGNDTGNGFDDESLIYIGTLSEAHFIHNTLVNNDINNLTAIFYAGELASFNIHNSIIDNNEWVLVQDSDAIINNSCNLLSENTTMSGFIIDQQLFVDKVNNDFQLTSSSMAIDFCSDMSATEMDLNSDIRGEVRPYDDPVVNVFGPADAGAYESLENDIIFKNGMD